MQTMNRATRRNLMLALTLAMLATATVGCSSEQLAQLQRERETLIGEQNIVAESINQQQTTVNQLRARAATMPADAPERKRIERDTATQQKLIDKQRKVYDEYAGKVIAADQAMDAILKGDRDSFTNAVATLPYGAWIALVGSLGWGVYERVRLGRTQQKAAQIVKSIDVAFPDKTEEQKLKLAAVQDTDTKAFVEKVK
jgi:hypothetical protein